jgi:outer membrane immunogenic protein
MRFHWATIAAVAIGAFAGHGALAADLPPSMPVKAPAQVVAYNWSGIYTASSIGGAGREAKGTFLDTPGSAFNTDPWRGWTGSAIGVQQQWGNIVLGVEGSWNTPLSNKFDSSVTPDKCLASPAFACQTRLNSIWTIGAKAGYSFGNWMLYGTGGYATGRLQSRLQDQATGLYASDYKTWNNGWYAGGGVDVYVTRIMWSDLIVGVEYKHIDLGSKDVIDPIPSGSRSLRTSEDMVMAKATFKWVGMGPLGMVMK